VQLSCYSSETRCIGRQLGVLHPVLQCLEATTLSADVMTLTFTEIFTRLVDLSVPAAAEQPRLWRRAGADESDDAAQWADRNGVTAQPLRDRPNAGACPEPSGLQYGYDLANPVVVG
jgi:hypothetical protein